MNEAKAMRAGSVELVNFLRHSARESSQIFLAEGLIPIDVKRKVEKDSDCVDQMVDCLIERVKTSPGDYCIIVGILEGIQGSSHVVEKLKDHYANKTGRQLTVPSSVPSSVPAHEQSTSDNGIQYTGAVPSGEVVQEPASTKCPSVGRRSGLIALAIVAAIAAIAAGYFILQSSISPSLERSTEEVKCHEIDSSKTLEGYLEQIDKNPEVICDRLELGNSCIQLKHERHLTPFYMAKEYLAQRAEACWEDIVRMLCENRMKKLARKLAEERGINYEQYCRVS